MHLHLFSTIMEIVLMDIGSFGMCFSVEVGEKKFVKGFEY